MWLYNLVVRSYGWAILFASVRKQKAKQWVTGRKNWSERLAHDIATIPGKRFWVHCASYGEFEQGRPFIEGLREKAPGAKIILSFFSPSGFEAFRDWEGAALVCYLPLDTPRNAKKFLDIVKPDAAFFIKYEFWLNFLSELKKRNVDTYLVSAVFKPHHPFFKRYGSIFRRSLSAFSRIFVQDPVSAQLLSNIGINNVEVCGDTRFDRVLQIKQTNEGIAAIQEFKGSSRLIVAGSTWPKDDELIIKAFKQLNDPGVKLLLVPHHVAKADIEKVENVLNREKLDYSVYSRHKLIDSRVLVLDAMGMLSKAYRYADVAYIGGGFNGGVHNTLEAAVYGVPVVFGGGPYEQFNEVKELIGLKAAAKADNVAGLVASIKNYLTQPDEGRSGRLSDYFQSRKDSTARVIAAIRV